MRERRDDEVRRHVEAGRTPVEEARSSDPAAPDEGATPTPLSFTEKAGVVDLGVEEPVLPEAAPDATQRAASPPTGMYAGETEADRQAEDAVRERLEERFPNTRGDWKDAGAMPDRDQEPDDA